MSKELKILHLVHDEKFIDIFINKFYQSPILNRIVCLKRSINYLGKHSSEIECIEPFSKLYFELMELNKDYDYIIAYNLDYEKAYFINRLSKGQPKIIWNFFGTEIYNNPNFRFLKNLYSKNTKNLLGPLVENKVKTQLRWIKYAIKGRLTPNAEVQKAIRKIDYFAWYSKEEYDYLKKEVSYIPNFINYPFENLIKESVISSTPISNRIMVGNSGAPENNHLDILTLLERVNYVGEIVVPFSYGFDYIYSKRLKEKIKSFNIKVQLLEEFLPYDLYLQHIASCEMAIFNSFRQMALGNILVSIVAGSKVYLSEKNISYTWLKNIGFKVFSIEKELKKDIETGEKSLTEEEWQTNKAAYNKLTDKKNELDFLNLLFELN